MYKKTIEFEDYNGVVRKEDHYFNLSKAELILMNSSEVGGLKAKMDRMLERQDSVAIMDMFRDLLHRSYGEKSEDGRQFIKNEALVTAFEQTEAYSNFFVELCTDYKAASDFINGVLPHDLAEAASKQAAQELAAKIPGAVPPVDPNAPHIQK